MSREQAEGKVVINTELRNKELIEGYKNISKETDKLISQYNKKVQQIKKEEVALDSLKAKYNQLMSGDKKSLVLSNAEKDLKKFEKEFDVLTEKIKKLQDKSNKNEIKINVINEKADSKKKFGYETYEARQERLKTKTVLEEQESIGVQIQELEAKIIPVEEEIDKLKVKCADLKLDPNASTEAQNLKAKIDLATESLEKSKNEANELAQNIKNAGKVNLSGILDPLKKFGNSIVETLNGRNSIGNKLDKFKSRVTKMFGAVMILRLLRNSLTALSNGFSDLLKSNKNFSNSLNQIKVNLMTAFAPIYNYVLPAINALMNVLSRVTGSIATFTASLFGKTADQAKKNAKELYNQANAQKSVADAQKESVASFDKLEVNSDNDKSNNSSNKLDFSKDIRTSNYLDKLLNDLKTKIGNGLWFDAGATIANELNSIVDKIDVKPFFNKGKNIASNLCKGINGFIKTFKWKELAVKVSDTIIGLGELILTTIKTIDWYSIGKAIGDFVLAIDWGNIVLTIVDCFFSAICGLGDLIIGLIDSIIELLENPEQLQKMFESGIKAFLSFCKGIGSVLYKIGELFVKILELISKLFGLDELKEVATEAMEGFLIGLASKILEIKNKFNEIWNSFIEGGKNAWLGIQNVFSSVASFFQNTFSNAWSKVKSVFSTGGKIFDGIKEGIVSAFKNIVNSIISGINKVISVPFNGINTSLSKIKNIDIMGSKPFKNKISTISVPQIPMLAQGAVIPPNAKFAAILGDQRNGKNLEAPESLIRKIVREESGENKEVILNGTFIMQCELEEIGRASVKGIRLVESETGTTLLVN